MPKVVRSAVLASVLLATLEACGGRPAPTDLRPAAIGFAALTGWGDDDLTATLPAWRASCRVLMDGQETGGRFAVAVEEWRAPCRAIPDPASSSEVIRQYVETWFSPVAVTGAEGEQGLFTGYYEPELAGARRRSAGHKVPLYARPRDLREVGGKIQPYYTRAEIDAGALAERRLELYWLADPVDAFFLQVQGSGRIRLADGRTVRVGYAGNNGHSYTAIGRVLVERGELTKETASLQTIRQWLRDHPGQATALMQMNARYIFFREIVGDGPVGSLGVALTPGRSLAVDPDHVPLGALMWLETSYPAGTPEAGAPLRRLMVAQDTGAAIKGAVRGDIFWGSGEAAARYAGPMRQPGRYFLLLPKAAAERAMAVP